MLRNGRTWFLVFLTAWLFVFGFFMWKVYDQTRDPLNEKDLRNAVQSYSADKVNLNITNTWSNGMQSMTSSWTDQQGRTQTVTTNRNEEESIESFKNRHKEAVDALMALYPPA